SQNDILIDAGADRRIELLLRVSRPDQEAATGVHHSHHVTDGEPVKSRRPDDPSPATADQFDGEFVFKDHRTVVEKMRRPVGRDPLGGSAALIGLHERPPLKNEAAMRRLPLLLERRKVYFNFHGGWQPGEPLSIAREAASSAAIAGWARGPQFIDRR